MRFTRFAFCAAVICACAGLSSLFAEDVWTEVRTPHLRVITNGTEDQARGVAGDFERMRGVLLWRLPGIRVDLNGPLTVYAIRDLATSLRLHPKWQDSELPDFYGNWERNLAFVDLQSWPKSIQRRVFLGYTHEVLRQASFVLPVWLDRGWTQLIGSVQAQGSDLVLGAPTERWISLKAQPLLSVRHIMLDKPLLGYSRGEDREREQQVNDAWGLVHYLTFGPGMKAGGLLLDYYRRLQRGEDSLSAFQAVFGEPSQMDAPFAAYIHAKSLAATMAPDLPVPNASPFPSRVLSANEVADEEGVIRIESHALADGQAIFERVLRSNPADSIANEELGVLDYDQGRLAEARGHWEAAARAEPSRYVSRFALVTTGAPLRGQSADERKQTLLDLQGIVRVNPRFSPAFIRIATLQWWQGSLDAALRACDEAERLDPSRDDYHLLHAELLLAQHDPRAAAAMARRVYNKELTEGQTATIGLPLASVLLWQSIPATDRDAGDVLSTGLPPEVKTVEGTVTGVQCGDARRRLPLRVTLQVATAQGSETLTLTGGNAPHVLWEDTTWIGGGHNPVCFAGKHQPALAAYKPGAKGYGELEQFELLNDVPSLPKP